MHEIRPTTYCKSSSTRVITLLHICLCVGGTNKISFVEQVYTGDRDLVLVQHSKYTDTLKSARVHEMELKKIASTTEFKLKQTKEQYSDDLRKLREDMERLIEKKKTEVEEQKTLLKEARSKRTRERRVLFRFCACTRVFDCGVSGFPFCVFCSADMATYGDLSGNSPNNFACSSPS